MNAVIYARYSSDNQREESIEGQLRECTAFADKRGLTIIHHYIDRAFPAKTDDRPEFQRMVKDSAKKQFEVVLVWKLDRFSRSRIDSAINKMVLKKNDVRVISATESISDGPEGILMEAVLEGYAEFYSAELSEKIIRGMKENAIKGKYTCGGVPLGYVLDSDKCFQIDTINAPIVREVFTRYADGETVTAITSSLNERGLVTKQGKPFNKNSLTKMLKNRKYIGEYQYRDVLNTDSIPPILNKELFERVQERMAKNKKAPAKAKAKEEYLLTTKLFCGKCGAYMVGESGTSKTGRIYYYYKCANAKRSKNCNLRTVKKDEIERSVVAYIKDNVLQDDVIDKIADAAMELQAKENVILPKLKKELQNTQKGIENMLDAIQKGVVTASTKQRLEALECRKEELEVHIAQKSIAKPLLTKEQIVFWISRFKDGDIDDLKFRKRVIDIFVNAVYVYDDRIVLFVNFKDGTKPVTLADMRGSDLSDATPPKTSRNWAMSLR